MRQSALALAGLSGRLFKMSRLNPYLPTGYATGTARDIGVRAFRGAGGLTLATGIGVLEESQAERFTGFFQGFDNALSKGKPLQVAFHGGQGDGSARRECR